MTKDFDELTTEDFQKIEEILVKGMYDNFPITNKWLYYQFIGVLQSVCKILEK